MKWYFLALLIWLLETIMFVSVILIPVIMYLRDNYEWFEKPFNTAYWNNRHW